MSFRGTVRGVFTSPLSDTPKIRPLPVPPPCHPSLWIFTYPPMFSAVTPVHPVQPLQHNGFRVPVGLFGTGYSGYSVGDLLRSHGGEWPARASTCARRSMPPRPGLKRAASRLRCMRAWGGYLSQNRPMKPAGVAWGKLRAPCASHEKGPHVAALERMEVQAVSVRPEVVSLRMLTHAALAAPAPALGSLCTRHLPWRMHPIHYRPDNAMHCGKQPDQHQDQEQPAHQNDKHFKHARMLAPLHPPIARGLRRRIRSLPAHHSSPRTQPQAA